MRSDSGASVSLWMESADAPAAPPLARDEEADVCVVGAGMAGMSAAYLLAREGRSVVVLDDGPPGGGETSRTTAHLTHVVDDRYFEIERLHGEDGARLTAESHSAAIDAIGRIAREEEIECDFRRLDAFLFVPPGDPYDLLERELQAARRAGLREVALVPRAPLVRFETGPCLRFPGQARFHPLRYLAGLARALERRGSRLHGGTHVERIATEGSPLEVATANGPVVRAREVVVATNSPIHAMVRYHTKQAPYRTFVIAAQVPRGSVADALYYDTPWPYHYVRLQRLGMQEYLVVGGEDHKTGHEDDGADRHARLERWARERFPMMGEVTHRWSGQVLEPVDGVAYLGRDPAAEHVHVITGDSGMGMTHSHIGATLVADGIAGRANPWAKLYEPGRVSLRAAGEFAKENLDVAALYAEHVTGGDVESPADLAPGQGAILRHGLRKLALYRDPGGRLHARSAVCTHLGCVVAWNSAEKTWDCPCHGSRFDPEGRVLNGPAIQPLEEAEVPEPKPVGD